MPDNFSAQDQRTPVVRTAVTPSLHIAYEEHGRANGPALILLHGWPYDPRSYDDVVGPLALAGFRVIVPYLRGFGPTVYRDVSIFRSGEQSALGKDVIELMDALRISKAILGGFDWGNRAAAAAAALYPDRVHAMVVGSPGYLVLKLPMNIDDLVPPDQIHEAWYRFILNTPQGPAYLAEHRKAYARKCWELWSPGWRFSSAFFEASAQSLENDEWVATTIHNYRHWYGNAPGDPSLASLSLRLYQQPSIAAPIIVLETRNDPMYSIDAPDDRAKFTGYYESRPLPLVGHNPPKEDPASFIQAVKDVARIARG
jgi:pimeloyl-ACP methyl ester carboxylesterase